MPEPIKDATRDAVSGFDYEAALARCARGEREALAALYKLECPRLLGVALRIVRERARAEDVLHDAFVKIWTRAATYDAQLGSARGWIYSVVRHAALNHVRNGAREVTLDEEAAEMLDADRSMQSHASSMSAFELRADLGQLGKCMEALPAARRDCILFAYVDGCSHGEIAERTGTPLGTVKAWVKRGMAALRECMS